MLDGAINSDATWLRGSIEGRFTCWCKLWVNIFTFMSVLWRLTITAKAFSDTPHYSSCIHASPTLRVNKFHFSKRSAIGKTPGSKSNYVVFISWQESATGDLQSPLTPESINGTDDERIPPDPSQNSEPRAETNAVPFPHRWTSEIYVLRRTRYK